MRPVAWSAKLTSRKRATHVARNAVLFPEAVTPGSASSSAGDRASTSILRIALDVDEAVDVEDVHRVVPAERRGARRRAAGDRVVEELEVHALVGARATHVKKSSGMPGVGLDRVRERVVDRLVASDVEAAIPRALDQRRRRRDEEEQVHDLPEAREQVAAGFVRVAARSCRSGSGRSAGATSRRAAPCAPCSGRASGRRSRSSSPVNAPAYLYGVAEAAVVEQLLAPDVGADQRELAPVARRCGPRAASAAAASCSCPPPTDPSCSSRPDAPAAAAARSPPARRRLRRPAARRARRWRRCRRRWRRGRWRRARPARGRPTARRGARRSAETVRATRAQRRAFGRAAAVACTRVPVGDELASDGGGGAATEQARPRATGARATRVARRSAAPPARTTRRAPRDDRGGDRSRARSLRGARSRPCAAGCGARASCA